MSTMARNPVHPPNDDENQDGPGRDDSTHFSWEFGAEEWESQGPRRSQAADQRLRDAARRARPSQETTRNGRTSRPSTPRPGTPRPDVIDVETIRTRAASIRRMLDAALDLWWMDGLLPAQWQLREGLELLAAGIDLPEPHRTLLLRTALVYGRGVVTALRYQTDPERVGLVMTELLLDELDPHTLAPLLDTHTHADRPIWRSTVARELRLVLATGDPTQRQRARAAFQVLFGDELGERVPAPPTARHTHGLWMRRLLLAALALALVGFVAWQRFQWLPPAEMVSIPEGVYLLFTPDGQSTVSVTTSGFFVDRFEVTNAEYRRCIERGACVWPVSNDSATRDDYFMAPAFNDYPVVNVTVTQAATYCSWRDKRLPTETEWQLAAAGPPGMPPTAYPWGVRFEAQRANALPAGFGDTLLVGFFRPAGDSHFGVSDLAGNVAELTTTSPKNEPTRVIVKGGSFRSEADELTVFAQEIVDLSTGLPWVGFRCVRGPVTGE